MHVVRDFFGEQGRFSVHLSYSIERCCAGLRNPSFRWGLQGKELAMPKEDKALLSMLSKTF